MQKIYIHKVEGTSFELIKDYFKYNESEKFNQ